MARAITVVTDNPARTANTSFHDMPTILGTTINKATAPPTAPTDANFITSDFAVT